MSFLLLRFLALDVLYTLYASASHIPQQIEQQTAAAAAARAAAAAVVVAAVVVAAAVVAVADTEAREEHSQATARLLRTLPPQQKGFSPSSCS